MLVSALVNLLLYYWDAPLKLKSTTVQIHRRISRKPQQNCCSAAAPSRLSRAKEKSRYRQGKYINITNCLNLASKPLLWNFQFFKIKIKVLIHSVMSPDSINVYSRYQECWAPSRLTVPWFYHIFAVLYPRQGRLKAGGEGVAEGEMVRWHHWLNGYESAQTLGDSEGQGSLACCSPWGRTNSQTWLSDWTTTNLFINSLLIQFKFPFASYYNHSLVYAPSKSFSFFWFILLTLQNH